MKTWQSIFLGFLLGLLSSGVILLLSRSPRGTSIKILPPPTPEAIMVQVVGEVNSPGVYLLPLDSRVINAVQAAGDFSPDADKESVNLAKKVNDGENIIIPKIFLTPPALIANTPIDVEKSYTQVTPSKEYPIDINSATEEELQMLPEIGITKAQQIISYREFHGKFRNNEEILNVPGIGPQIYEQIKSLISTGE